MEHSRLRVWLFGSAIVVLLPGVAVAQPELPRENHYNVYNSSTVTYTEPLLLRDQFGPYQVQDFSLEAWGNPAEKIHNGVSYPPVDPFIHQMWWRAYFPPIEQREIIGIDQFGTNKWTIGSPEYLLTPALKNVQGGAPPAWNHYLCYATRIFLIEQPVVIIDQFGTASVQVVYARWFCNPVEKTHLADGRVYTIIDAKAHLACYGTSNANPFVHPVVAVDQFGNWQFEVWDNFCLCVPALKEHVVRTEQSTWGRIKALYD